MLKLHQLYLRFTSAIKKRGAQVPTSVRAEMVASVLSIEVIVGESVEPGHTMLILESMKMEIPVLTELGGRVTDIAVAPGDVVNEGDILVTLE
jgi:acetyl-CoA carboxylase biotin carboxyl carrier protein